MVREKYYLLYSHYCILTLDQSYKQGDVKRYFRVDKSRFIIQQVMALFQRGRDGFICPEMSVVSCPLLVSNGSLKMTLPCDCFSHLSCYHIYPTPPLGQDMTQGQFLSGV